MESVERATIAAVLMGVAVLCWVAVGISLVLAKINPLHGDDL